jgi:fatty acyl-CoA reductase
VGRLTFAAFRVREIDPALLEKVEVVNGDITEDNLGIDEQAERYAANLENTNFKRINLSVLTESVNVVFHCAATVRFDEDLTKSVAMNVSAVLAIIDLAKKMKNLEVKILQ